MTKEQKEELRRKQVESGHIYGKKNLIPINERPQSEQLEIRQKGAEAVNEIKRRKKDIKEICDAILSIDALDIAKGNVSQDILDRMEALEMGSLYDVIIAKQAENALNGSTKAAEFIRDSRGDKPQNSVDVDISIITDSDRALLNNLSNRIEALEAIDSDTTS